MQNNSKDLADVNKKLENADADNTKKRKEISVLEDTINKLKDQVIKVQTARDETMNELDNVTKVKDGLCSKLANAEKICNEKDDEIKSLLEKNGEGLKEKENLESRLDHMEKNLNESKVE